MVSSKNYAEPPPSPEGWCSIEKANKFKEIITQNRPELCVEIGVFGGASLIPQALALKENKKGIIYGIDPWTIEAALEEMVDEENINWWSKINFEKIHKECRNYISHNELNKHCRLIHNKSENVADRFSNIDLLHIDGNHSEKLSYKDVELYLPRVKSGGYVFFNEIWWSENGYPTTRKAVILALNSCTRIDVVDNCLIMKKN